MKIYKSIGKDNIVEIKNKRINNHILVKETIMANNQIKKMLSILSNREI